MLASVAVGIFQRLEALLEHLVEAPASRMGATLQPVTLGKRIERAMDGGKIFRQDGVVVPNRYELQVHPDDYARFASYRSSLEDDLAHEALTRARQRDYRLVARPRVTVMPADGVPRGEVRVAASVTDEEADSTPQPEAPPATVDTMVLARTGHEMAPPASAGRAFLVVQTDGALAARFDLGGPLIGIGRGPDNDVIVDDPQVSRHHCQLTLQHGAYGFVDLGSRNGSTVNGQTVSEVALGPGDVIRIGRTTIAFQVRE